MSFACPNPLAVMAAMAGGAAAVLLLGCASRVALPPLPDCHPANPAAPAAEYVRPSGLLEPAAPMHPTEQGQPEDGHHHQHGEDPPEGSCR
ncbi:MAG TPA: hypothetical protein VMT16_08775 [Thermoanaerobaculia bacterium]|nr:hypothetical protein [Thermoanaerobaculia bacterium]